MGIVIVRSGYARAAFSLIEAAIVLAIVGLVIGGIWVASATVNENRRITKTLEDISLIYSNANKHMKNVPDWASYSQNDVDLLRMILPPDYSVSATDGVKGVFGNIEMYLVGPPNNFLQMSLSGLSVASCAKLGVAAAKAFKKSLVDPPSGLGCGGDLTELSQAVAVCQCDMDDVGTSGVTLFLQLR